MRGETYKLVNNLFLMEVLVRAGQGLWVNVRSQKFGIRWKLERLNYKIHSLVDLLSESVSDRAEVSDSLRNTDLLARVLESFCHEYVSLIFSRNWVFWTCWMRRVGFPRAQTRAFLTNYTVLTRYEELWRGNQEAWGWKGREGEGHKCYYSIVIFYWSIGHHQLETTSISLPPPQDNSYYIKPKVNNAKFGIQHYAGEVFYDVNGLLEKNRDTFRDDMLKVLRESK